MRMVRGASSATARTTDPGETVLANANTALRAIGLGMMLLGSVLALAGTIGFYVLPLWRLHSPVVIGLGLVFLLVGGWTRGRGGR
jgi:hypothetical protein